MIKRLYVMFSWLVLKGMFLFEESKVPVIIVVIKGIYNILKKKKEYSRQKYLFITQKLNFLWKITINTFYNLY